MHSATPDVCLTRDARDACMCQQLTWQHLDRSNTPTGLKFTSICRNTEAARYCVDRVALTRAAGTTCTVPVISDLETGAGVVWVIALYRGLGCGRPGLTKRNVHEQFKRLGARLCTAAEKRLLITLPGVSSSLRDTMVVSVPSACQWLLHVGQPVAAEQLSRYKQPLPAAPPAVPRHATLNGDDADTHAAQNRTDGGRNTVRSRYYVAC